MSITGKTKVAGVMGWPVGHSKSPALHNYWLSTHGIDGVYVPMAVEPARLADALQGLPALGFSGCNLTVPHKEAALKMVDRVTPEAERIGAINTVFVGQDSKLTGTNTDGFGFLANLKSAVPGLDPAGVKALVLGAGGAARAVCAALLDAGCRKVVIANRNQERATTLAGVLGGNAEAIAWDERHAALADTGLLINATSLGMTGQPALDIAIARLPRTGVVYDLVYAPLETPLLAAARAGGWKAVDGLGMLLYQAQAGFAGWFGVTPEITPELRAYVLSQP
ncbi:MAG: shikimate dehydrogenase [Rhodobacteraceae bacterium]|nr:shikimate dehydrogenase [Paracoccaceae bacterium]